jgi:hypothetical protein
MPKQKYILEIDKHFKNIRTNNVAKMMHIMGVAYEKHENIDMNKDPKGIKILSEYDRYLSIVFDNDFDKVRVIVNNKFLKKLLCCVLYDRITIDDLKHTQNGGNIRTNLLKDISMIMTFIFSIFYLYLIYKTYSDLLSKSHIVSTVVGSVNSVSGSNGFIHFIRFILSDFKEFSKNTTKELLGRVAIEISDKLDKCYINLDGSDIYTKTVFKVIESYTNSAVIQNCLKSTTTNMMTNASFEANEIIDKIGSIVNYSRIFSIAITTSSSYLVNRLVVKNSNTNLIKDSNTNLIKGGVSKTKMRKSKKNHTKKTKSRRR